MQNRLAILGQEWNDVSRALEWGAACEVVARLQGRWGVRDAYSKAVDDWVVAHPQMPGRHIVIDALEVIDRIAGASSELAELWKGQDVWAKAVADLRARVAG